MTSIEKLEREREKAREAALTLIDNGQKITMDGREAALANRYGDFPTIYEVNDPCRSAQWSWHATLNILTKHKGNFTT